MAKAKASPVMMGKRTGGVCPVYNKAKECGARHASATSFQTRSDAGVAGAGAGVLQHHPGVPDRLKPGCRLVARQFVARQFVARHTRTVPQHHPGVPDRLKPGCRTSPCMATTA